MSEQVNDGVAPCDAKLVVENWFGWAVEGVALLR